MPRQKVPTKLKILRGTERPCRQLVNEVDYEEIKDISSPELLTGTAKAEWERILPILQSRKLATQADVLALLEYCWLYSKMVMIFEKVTDANFISNLDGMLVTNPYIKEYYKLSDKFRSISTRFGFSPADRTRINMPEQKKKESFDDQFFKKAM